MLVESSRGYYHCPMSLKLKLFDPDYPIKGNHHVRKISRALLMNEEGTFAIHFIERDDIFGHEFYIETPGGGVDEGETFEEALVRECDEETGYDVEVLEYLGEVDDWYNLINRNNINQFFLAKTLPNPHKKHFASSGDSFIKETKFLPVEEIISIYEKESDHGVTGIVKRRELPFFKMLAMRNKDK